MARDLNDIQNLGNAHRPGASAGRASKSLLSRFRGEGPGEGAVDKCVSSRVGSTQPDSAVSRRRMLNHCSSGFGAVALSALLAREAAADDSQAMPWSSAVPRARNVIFLYMSGGVSHVDSFDPKPKLNELHGKPMPVTVQRTQFNQNGNVMASPFEFRKWGQSGLAVSSMFPKLGTVADELAVVRSMTTPVNEHAQGNFMMHCGFPFMGFPTAGAWMSYGLGSGNRDLPSYVVLQSGSAVPPHGGVSLYSSGFLPAQHQGSILKADREEAIRNIRGATVESIQRQMLDFVRTSDSGFLANNAGNSEVEAAIQNYETAFRMQSAVPELCEIGGETAETLSAYGIDSPDSEMSAYGRQCLLARRLVERGVRFVELSCLTRSIGAGGAANPWDQHGDLQRGHAAMARMVDQPITALITDLRQRGMLQETLLIWAGEFGRTPFSQGSNGRDHNPYGFSIWFAGGGVRGGTAYGATDELGYYAVEDKCTIYDMWATALHQLGINHEKLTYRYGGRDFRLTDVHGNVLHDILA
jgi:hypothetical protein